MDATARKNELREALRMRPPPLVLLAGRWAPLEFGNSNAYAIHEAQGDQAMNSEAQSLLSFVFFIIAAAAGAYFGSYFHSKGSQRALREDIDTLTRATEEIKAQISQSAWVGQRRWDLKRELYTDLLRSVYRILHIDDTVWDLYMAEQRTASEEHRQNLEKRSGELLDQRRAHFEEIIKVRGIGELLLSTETTAAIDELLKSWAAEAEAYYEYLDNRLAATRKGYEKLVAAAKQDLELGGQPS
jgi:hypothetical protein